MPLTQSYLVPLLFRQKEVMSLILIFLALTLAPFSIAASDLSGHWSGRGSCYLSRTAQVNSTCDYIIRIEHIDETLSILKCLIWIQEWGEGRECQRREFEVRQNNELWITDHQNEFKAGQIIKNKVLIEHPTPGGSVEESFVFEGTSLSYEGMYQTSSMRWNYWADLESKALDPQTAIWINKSGN